MEGVRQRRNLLILMAGPTGLEPATSGVTGRRSNQLNYDPAVVMWQAHETARFGDEFLQGGAS